MWCLPRAYFEGKKGKNPSKDLIFNNYADVARKVETVKVTPCVNKMTPPP